MSHDKPTQTPDATDSLAPKLGPACVGLRADLEVHRHVFRGEPSYVLRDPVTLAVHRVSAEDYQIVAALDQNTALSDVLARLIAEGVLEDEDAEPFYRFILTLHSLGFLSLPVPDDKSLYERRLKKQRAQTMAKVMGFLFMQIPVWNPDAFLQRTAHLVSWAFSRWAVAIWCAVVGAAVVLLWQSRGAFFEPITNAFTPGRLLGMWFTLVFMKVLHEFGHAYACRRLGGEVPEMGVYLIAGTPCAYVDATSSWGFTRRRDRISVILAGMYVELFVAALAVFFWASTSSPTLQVIAFDIVLVAGIATILANLNPLMRFDGYYLASDFLEIPNLRSTAQGYTVSLLKRAAIGTPALHLPYGGGVRALLAVFGIASTVYKFTIVLGISALLATKALWLGIGLAAFYVGTELIKALRNIGVFLVHSDEAKQHRIRCGVLALFVFGALPACLVFLPVPSQVKATATAGREQESLVYPSIGGFLETVAVSEGQAVEEGSPIASLKNITIEEQAFEAAADFESSSIVSLSALTAEPSAARVSEIRRAASRAGVEHAQRQIEAGTLRVPHAGVVIDALGDSDLGRYIAPDTPVATVADGRWIVRAMVRAEVFAAVGLERGDEVAFRSAADPGVTHRAKVIRVTPAASKQLDNTAYTVESGGDVTISPTTGEASEGYFLVEAAIADPAGLAHGVSGRVRLGVSAEPIATRFWRSALRVMQRLERGS
ncbi:MAG: HlyD family efflux transporter periplasmic adaptor subunit [Planctomycetota bacterium]